MEGFKPERKKLSPEKALAFAGALAGMTAVEIPQSVAADFGKSYGISRYASEKLARPHVEERLPHDAAQEAKVAEALAMLSNNLKSPSVQKALHGDGPDPLHEIIKAVELPLSIEQLKGTDRDPSAKQKHIAQLAYQNELMRETQVSIRTGRGGTDAFVTEKEYGYGNGFFLGDRYHFVANDHVAKNIMTRTIEKTRVGERDINVLTVPKELAPKDDSNVITYEPLSAGQELAGSLVCALGAKPDSTADAYGRKAYCGVAFPITEGLVRNVIQPGKGDIDWAKEMPHMYALVIAPGEAEARATGSRHAEGMSGSAVWVYDNASRSYKIDGVLVGWGLWPDGNRTVSIAYFLPLPDALKTKRDTGRVALSR